MVAVRPVVVGGQRHVEEPGVVGVAHDAAQLERLRGGRVRGDGGPAGWHADPPVEVALDLEPRPVVASRRWRRRSRARPDDARRRAAPATRLDGGRYIEKCTTSYDVVPASCPEKSSSARPAGNRRSRGSSSARWPAGKAVRNVTPWRGPSRRTGSRTPRASSTRRKAMQRWRELELALVAIEAGVARGGRERRRGQAVGPRGGAGTAAHRSRRPTGGATQARARPRRAAAAIRGKAPIRTIDRSRPAPHARAKRRSGPTSPHARADPRARPAEPSGVLKMDLHARAERARPADPLSLRHRVRGDRRAGRLAHPLEALGPRPVAGEHPQRPRRPRRARVPAPAAHERRPRPDRQGVPPLHRRADAGARALERRRGRHPREVRVLRAGPERHARDGQAPVRAHRHGGGRPGAARRDARPQAAALPPHRPGRGPRRARDERRHRAQPLPARSPSARPSCSASTTCSTTSSRAARWATCASSSRKRLQSERVQHDELRRTAFELGGAAVEKAAGVETNLVIEGQERLLGSPSSTTRATSAGW